MAHMYRAIIAHVQMAQNLTIIQPRATLIPIPENVALNRHTSFKRRIKIMTITEFSTTELYKATATTQSKAFCFSFIIYCLYFMLFTHYSIGLWWIPIIVIGLFISSICFAMPYTLIIVKRMLFKQNELEKHKTRCQNNPNIQLFVEHSLFCAAIYCLKCSYIMVFLIWEN